MSKLLSITILFIVCSLAFSALSYDDEVAEKKKERATTIPLNISVNEIVGEVGTIDNPGTVDINIDPITEPPVVSVDEARSYKDLQDSLTNLDVDGNKDIGKDGEELN